MCVHLCVFVAKVTNEVLTQGWIGLLKVGAPTQKLL